MTDNATGIERIGARLRDFIRDRKIVARCELLNRIYDYVRGAELSDFERDEIGAHVGLPLAPGIFANILSGETIFFDLPKLDTYTTLGGKIFHFVHTEKYSRQDFDNAYRNFTAALPEIRTLLIENLSELLKEFMKGAGYEVDAGGEGRISFRADDRRVDVTLLPVLSALDLDLLKPHEGADQVVLVPSSESAEPFVAFYRDHGTRAEEMGLQVWVANMEKGTIDPFVGFTTDMDIYNKFKNPRLAETVRSTWGRNV